MVVTDPKLGQDISTASCTFCGETGINLPHQCDIKKEGEMDLSLKHDAADCLREDCGICAGRSWTDYGGYSDKAKENLLNIIGSIDVPKPNRFDPYEALDMILKIFRACEELQQPERDGLLSLPPGDREAITAQVYALRAYITGREQ